MLAAALATFSLLYFTQALLPEIGDAFEVRPAAAALTVSVSTGALALAMLPMAALAESVGRVRVMRWSLLAACVLAFLSAGAPTFGSLLVLRGLLGLCLAGVVAVAVGHVGDEIHPLVVGRAIGLYVAGNSLGGVAGRLVPGLVVDLAGWRVAVLVLVGFAAAASTYFVVRLPRARAFTPATEGVAGHVRHVVELWREPRVRRLCLVGFLLMGGFVGCYNFLTFRLTAAPFDLPASLVSLLFLAYLAGTVSSTFAGRLSDRWGRRTVLCASTAVAVAGLLLTLPDVLVLVPVGLVIFTAGFFGAHAVATAWIAAPVSHSRGLVAGQYLTAYYLGSSVLGALVGLPFESFGWAGVVLVVTGVYVLVGVVALGIPDTRRPRGRRGFM
jgi:YNFM family putative membrane transporter